MARKPQSNGAVPDGWEIFQPTTAATAPVAPPAPDQSAAAPPADAGAAVPEGFEPEAQAPAPDKRFLGVAPATTGPELVAGLKRLSAARVPSSVLHDYLAASNSPDSPQGLTSDFAKKYDQWLAANPNKRPTIDWQVGPQPKGPDKTGKAQAAFDGLKSSATFGWDDELSGLGAASGNWLARNTPVNRLLGVFGRRLDEGTGQGFAADMERERAGRDQEKTDAWNEHPVMYGAGYAGGIIPTLVLPGGRVANLSSKTAKVAGAAGVGGLYGAVSGAGNEADDRVTGAELGAGGGALFGTIAPPLARIGGKLAYRLGDATGVNAMVRGGLSGLDTLMRRSPQDAAALADRLAERRGMGFQDNPLVDLVDEPGAATIRAAAGKQTPGRTQAVDFANARRVNVQDETARVARHISPTSEPAADTISRVETARSALADDQYAQFRDAPVPVTPDLRRVLDTGAGRKALASAIETSDNPQEVAGFLSALKRGNEPSELDRVMGLLPEGMAPAARDQVRAQLTAQGVKGADPLPTFTVDMLDRVKRSLQARQNSPDASGQSRILGQMVNTLIGEGEKAAPGYSAARANFKAASGLVDAADHGTTALTGGNPDEAIAASRALSDAPTPMMRTRSPEGTLALTPPKDDDAIIQHMASELEDQYGGDFPPGENAASAARRHFGENPEAMRREYGGQSAFSYTLPDGRKISGQIHRAPGSRDGVVDIDNIPNWDDVRNTYGPGVMRDMIYALRQQMPDLDNLRGFRVTGTHAAPTAAAGDTGIANVSTKPQMVAGPSARSIARQTARRNFENTANESPRAALGLADKTAVGGNMLNRMTALVGDEAAGRMRAEAGAVRSRYDRAQFVSPNTGSQTQTRGADAATNLIDFGINALGGGKIGLVRAVARHLNNAGIGNRDAERLVSMALDPSRVDEAIAYLGRKTDEDTARRIVTSIRATQLGAHTTGSSVPDKRERQLTDPINLDEPVQ